MAAQDYFSLVTFFIIMREALEASVIVAILLQVMNRVLPRLKRQVWFGALAGLALALLIGAAFIITYYVAKNALFSGPGAEIFEGVMMWFAALLITILAFAMVRFHNIEARMKHKLETAARKAAAKAQSDLDASRAARLGEVELEDIACKDPDAAHDAAEAEEQARKEVEHAMHKSHKWAIFFLAFTSVFREGLETVLFMFGVGTTTPATAIPLAAFAGLVAGVGVGLLLFYSGKQLKDFRVFFICSTILLLFIAAGQVGNGQLELEAGGAFGPTAQEAAAHGAPAPEVPWYNQELYDWNGCCSEHETAPNAFFQLVGALFGYNATPTPLWYMCYASYWILVIVWALIQWRRGTLFDKDGAYRKRFARQGVRQDSDDMQQMIADARKQDRAHFQATLHALLTCRPLPKKPPLSCPDSLSVGKHMPANVHV